MTPFNGFFNHVWLSFMWNEDQDGRLKVEAVVKATSYRRKPVDLTW